MDRAMVDGRYDLDPRAGPGTLRSLIDPDLATYTDVALLHLGPRKPSRRQLDAANVAADDTVQTFLIWASELAESGLTPKVGDLVVDADGVAWAVRLVETVLFATRHYATCVRAD